MKKELSPEILERIVLLEKEYKVLQERFEALGKKEGIWFEELDKLLYRNEHERDYLKRGKDPKKYIRF